jgi:hypothetical protein
VKSRRRKQKQRRTELEKKHREEEEEGPTTVQATPQAATTNISTKLLQREKNIVDRGSKGNKREEATPK